MFRKIMLLAGIAGMISAACADTIIPGGNVSGTWAAGGSPFLIMGEITVPSGQTLNIQPGVQVIFQGHYKLIVNGWLNAIGTEADSILFTAANTTTGWWGIRFINAPDSSAIRLCRFQYGRATGSALPENEGGGIYISQTYLELQNCSFRHCSANTNGGAISIRQSDVNVDSCSFFQNSAAETGNGGGGAIMAWESNHSISNCTFLQNSSGLKGGALYFESDISIVENNIFLGNTAAIGGGITAGTTSDLQIRNNTFYNNSGYGIQWGTGSTEIVNCILWSNSPNQLTGGFTQVSFCDIQGGYLGTGNINANPLFVSGPDGDFYLSQIAAGQSQNSPCVNAGDPAFPMIFGTTRTDGVQDQGVVDMGYHYTAFGPPPPPPPLDITLTPSNPPIVIPAAGGWFAFVITIDNNTDSTQTFDGWTVVQLPNGIPFPLIPPISITLPANASLFRARDQYVPPNAPAGNYIYRGFIGTYPWIVADSSSFPFTKLGSNRDWLGAEGWICSGEPFPAVEINAEKIRNSSFVIRNSPNPFNPTTVLRFDLPQAAWVKLEVFDINGRNVGARHAAPLSGSGPTPTTGEWYTAGTHEVTFDGSNLPSGIYFARLQARKGASVPEEYVGVQKLVLLK